MRKFGRKVEVVRGFYPSQGKLGADRVPGSFIEGLNVILRGLGLPESVGPALLTGGLTGAAFSMLVGNTVGGIGSGTVVMGPGGDIYAVGSGTAFGAGSSFTAQSYLQFRRGGVLYVAGLNAPGAGSIATPAPVDLNSTKVSGSYSVKFTKRRTQTGIESNSGPVSNVVNTKASDNINKQLKITLPGSGGETHDVFGLYVTPRNYGAIGPHYWFNDIPVAWNGSPAITGLTATGSPGIFYLDINDSDLDPQTRPPTDHFYPPTGAFFFFLGNVAVIVGTFGGTGVSPSIPGIYEAFPPTYTTFLPEPPLGVKGRATDGWVYILCRNSLNACILSGSEITPIVTRTIWPETGVANGNAAAMVGGGLYVWSGPNMGALRTNGDSNEPDSSFAKPVQSYFRDNGWGSNVVVGYSPEDDGVVYCNGSTALVYHRALDAWSSPISLGMTPVSAVTYQGSCYLSDGAAMYRFGAGGGVISWNLTPVWDDADEPQNYKIIETLQGSGSNGILVELLKNLSGSAVESMSLNGTHSSPKKTYIKNVRSFTVKFSGTSAGQRVEELVIKGLSTDMRC